MKLYLFIIALFLNHCSYSQYADSLNKYSYNLYGSKAVGKGGYLCSGFFIRTNKSIYFITAKHCMGCDKDKGKVDEGYPDTMFINLNGIIEYPIDIRVIKDTVKCDSLDFFVIKIDSTYSPYINSLELNVPNRFDFNISEIKLIGYPPEAYKTKEGVRYVLDVTAQTQLFKNGDFHFNIKNTYFDIYLNKIVEVFLSNEIIKNIEFGGYSGSPFYVKLSDNKWYLLGCFYQNGTGAVPNYTRFYFTSIRTILQDIILKDQ